MASGGSLPLMTGTFDGTGALITIDVGYRPRVVILTNMDDPGLFIHTDRMPDANAYADDGTPAEITSDGITITATGFTVGTAAGMNTAGEQVHYVTLG